MFKIMLVSLILLFTELLVYFHCYILFNCLTHQNLFKHFLDDTPGSLKTFSYFYLRIRRNTYTDTSGGHIYIYIYIGRNFGHKICAPSTLLDNEKLTFSKGHYQFTVKDVVL